MVRQSGGPLRHLCIDYYIARKAASSLYGVSTIFVVRSKPIARQEARKSMSNFENRLAARVADVSPTAMSFLVGQNAKGNWVALETHGLAGGVFVSREAALHYAEFETDHRSGAVRLAPRPLDLKV